MSDKNLKHFIDKIQLSFDIITDNDIIKITCYRMPVGNSIYVEHKSQNGGGMLPVDGLTKGIKSEPLEIAARICEEIKAGTPKAVKNIKKNRMELKTPALIEIGHVKPNYPKKEKELQVQRLEGYAAFVDVRGFSEWAKNAEDSAIADLYDLLCVRVVEMARHYQYDFWKMLGDGVMLIWEKDKTNYEVKSGFIIEAMIGFQRDYSLYKAQLKTKSKNVPEGLGMSVCKGELIKYEAVTFYELCVVRDYLGPLVNTAARFQSIADSGEIIINSLAAIEYGLIKCTNVTQVKNEQILKLKGVPAAELSEIYKINYK